MAAGGAAGGGKAGGRLQVRKAAKGGWTPAKRAAFLEHLAGTCNIAASARAVGMAPRGAHALKARDAVFAADWARAIEAAYETLEVRLLAYALGETEGEAEAESEGEADGVVDGDAEAELRGAHFDPRVAVQALGFRKRGGAAVGAGAGTLRKRVSLAELEAVLVARLDALDAQAASAAGDA
ncbi:hypothetical protein [Sphingomonas sp. CFBP 13706]|uniref:hypothetical protein n=1 Tax=Sphingomonas sp. CFBP 13706 TaxID=2775314 RepID=UPI001784AD27|nr:hypothetical protein [Sphingomonas sp. CFBP 13706]MBD8736031.1 hypothetical protein [Sphingomonas sp. CFBP 13706]